MNKTLIILLLVLGITYATKAQSVSSCDPSACGPENTKVAEAKVITQLKQEMREIRSLATNAGIDIKESALSLKSIQSLPLDIQQNRDDAALLEIAMEVFGMKNTLLPTQQEIQPYSNKAQLVASLRSDIQLIRNKLEIN